MSYQRAILGAEPLQWLFEHGTHVLCTPETEAAWYRGHRLMALDGSLFNVAETKANAQAFGRSCNQYGKGAYPQARAVMLTECGSHATVGLHLGDYDEAEIHGAYALLPGLQRGMLLMHDANFFGGAYLEALNAKGVRALFVLASTVALERVRNLADGSYLARLRPQSRAVYPMQRAVYMLFGIGSYGIIGTSNKRGGNMATFTDPESIEWYRYCCLSNNFCGKNLSLSSTSGLSLPHKRSN